MSYDHNYVRRRRQRQQTKQPAPSGMPPISRAAVLNVLIGLAVGVGLGLLVAWVLLPPPYANLSPDTLRRDFETDYMIMIAQAYSVDFNLPVARQRLSTLNLTDPENELLARTEALIAINARESDLRALARLCQALGASSPALAPYLP